MSIYTDMLDAGLVHGSRYSDPYVKHTPKAREILAKHGKTVDGWSVVSFVSEADNVTQLLEIAFAYDPYWNKKES